MPKISVSREDLKTLIKLVSNANMGRCKDFHGKEIEISDELFRDIEDWYLLVDDNCTPDAC